MEVRSGFTDVGFLAVLLARGPERPEQVVVPVDEGCRPQQLDDPVLGSLLGLGHRAMLYPERWYAFRMSVQIAIRIPDDLAEELETLVSSGRFETKADAVRSALEALVDAERRAGVGRQIVEGYQRVPQDDADVASAHEAAIRSIDEEPW
jgi:Arc/MetJ-type ribon-helix-helix transcriptional regulator